MIAGTSASNELIGLVNVKDSVPGNMNMIGTVNSKY
jgi:hypothetical protein